MASDRDEIELLQSQMERVRKHLDEDVHDLVQNARAAVDWRRHWRSHPWIGCAAAMTVGYVLVPGRRIVELDGQTRRELLPAGSTSSGLTPARKVVAEFGGMALGLVLREGFRFLGRQVGQFLEARSHPAYLSRNDGGTANDNEQYPDQRHYSAGDGREASEKTPFAARD